MTATSRRRQRNGPPRAGPAACCPLLSRVASRRRGGVLSPFLFAIAIVLVAALATPTAAEYNPTKCSACEAVASELRGRLDNESRTAPIDLRGRLGPNSGSGNRRGRLVEWRKSEQRAVELLEGLCAKMAPDYRLVVGGGDGGGDAEVWRKYKGVGKEEGVSAPPASGQGAAAHEAQQKKLAADCGLLLEQVEEELVEALREDGGEVSVEEQEVEEVGASKLDVSALLCRRLTRRCEGKEKHRAAAAAASTAALEVDEDDESQDKGRGGEL